MQKKDFLSEYKKQKSYSIEKTVHPVNNELISVLRAYNIFSNFTRYDKINCYEDVIIEPHVTFYVGNCMQTIGSFSYSNSELPHGMSIGRYCSIGYNLKIFGPDHFTTWISTSPRFYSSEYQNTHKDVEISHHARNKHCINIGHDVWIGDNVTLKKDISIGTGSIIGAGSIVTHDVEPFTIVAGVPAKLIRYRFDKKIIEQILEIEWWKYHADDLKNMHADNPQVFLSMLRKMIIQNEIKQFCPAYFTSDNLKSSEFWYKNFIRLIDNKYSNLILSNDYSKKYYHIYIYGINKRIHYELLKSETLIYLCFDIEMSVLCSNNDIKIAVKNIHNSLSCGELLLNPEKISIVITVTPESFSSTFALLYNVTTNLINSLARSSTS